MITLGILFGIACLQVEAAPNAAIKSDALPHARGLPPSDLSLSKSFQPSTPFDKEHEDNIQMESIHSHQFSSKRDNIANAKERNFYEGGGAGPVQTIYVNVPPENYPPPKPIPAGPPRKHYRIVFIRSPVPPPPQPIIPPRVEQKTLIYVLHPKPQQQGQNVVEVTGVNHDPEVFFVQYDKEPPSPHDLQNLVKNTITGPASHDLNINSRNIYGQGKSSTVGKSSGRFETGPPAPIDVLPPSPKPVVNFASLNQPRFKKSPSTSQVIQVQPVQPPRTFKPKRQKARNNHPKKVSDQKRQLAPVFVKTERENNEEKVEKSQVSPPPRFSSSQKTPRPTRRFPKNPKESKIRTLPKSTANAKHLTAGGKNPTEPSDNFKTVFGDRFPTKIQKSIGREIKTKKTHAE